jgi:hypothetical protein
MPEIHVYEPALCCTTGVCGPELDQDLVHFTADVSHVTEAGGQVARHNLASDPHAFVNDDTVRNFMHLAGSDGLPLTAVDGVTVLTGRYPTRAQLRRFAGLPDTEHEATLVPVPGTEAPPRSLNLIGSTGAACVPGADDGTGGGCC